MSTMIPVNFIYVGLSSGHGLCKNVPAISHVITVLDSIAHMIHLMNRAYVDTVGPDVSSFAHWSSVSTTSCFDLPHPFAFEEHWIVQ